MCRSSGPHSACRLDTGKRCGSFDWSQRRSQSQDQSNIDHNVASGGTRLACHLCEGLSAGNPNSPGGGEACMLQVRDRCSHQRLPQRLHAPPFLSLPCMHTCLHSRPGAQQTNLAGLPARLTTCITPAAHHARSSTQPAESVEIRSDDIGYDPGVCAFLAHALKKPSWTLQVRQWACLHC